MDCSGFDRQGSPTVNAMRPVSELRDVADPAWPDLRRALEEAAVPVSVVPIERPAGESVLYRLQVTARSVLGALAVHTGGVLVDDGWLRLLGGGGGDLPDLASINRLGDPAAGRGAPGSLVVALDVFGGKFAINGGSLPGAPGEICYFAPETLTWQSIGGGHSAFVTWALSGGLEEFYRGLRWPGWQREVSELGPGQGLSVFPPLWSSQGRRDVAGASRKTASLSELVTLHEDSARQLADLPSGSRVQVRLKPSSRPANG